MDTLPCSCSGENQNCFKCFGTGLVRTKAEALGRPKANLAEALANPPRPSKPQKPRRSLSTNQRKEGATPLDTARKGPFKPVASQTLCPICLKLVKTGTLGKHRRRAHAGLSSLSHEPPSVPPPPPDPPLDIGACPLCKKSVTRLTAHFAGAHLAKLQPKERELVKKAIRTMTCPKCNTSIETMVQLLEHLLDGHGYRGMMLEGRRHNHTQTTAGTRGSGTRNGQERDQGKRASLSSGKALTDSSRFTERGDPATLDAKLGWGGSFRDHGQFGSYPSHDAMDDESSA